jgi:hypothetical protein
VTRTDRRRLFLYLTIGLEAGGITMVVLTVVQPGPCDVAATINHQPGCGTSELLWMFHLIAALGAAILGVLAAHRTANFIANRNTKNRNPDDRR